MQRVLRALRDKAVLSNTYIIFLSDNGYALGEHRFRGGKVKPYDIALKVPLAIRGPGIARGTEVTQAVGIHDLAPTILAMTSNEGTNGSFMMDGLNVLPMLGDPAYRANRPLVFEGAPPNGELLPDWVFQGVITPKWKYFERHTGVSELYDRTNDPWELRNRAADPAFANVKANMRQLKTRLQFCRGSACWN